MEQADIVINRILQFHYFEKEIDRMTSGETIDKTCSLISPKQFTCKANCYKLAVNYLMQN